ncbi:hypothetical protein [Ponticaulis sp.]|uniref:hypothetical protein n=1 Tax=Ponticaulis sp. TaxID=2020902 RepID=UPI000B744C1E|nr:hypothetical protein [Ponticaulis sp.]MAI91220.1 hypothetical protein [Ponticaulis sp.]OUX98533.1 MAG: hypothetical protein CBB65_12300 [Hyphomonadaceae bacterium TMED5]|tara:strand:- start:63723 stop:64355 length:633 start_codon:yes stop_codon:yes gene_type:complete
MHRLKSGLITAASAVLLAAQARAQSATVDASATVVELGQDDTPLSITGFLAGDFGEVTIPENEGSICRYIVGPGAGDENINVYLAGRIWEVYGPQTGEGPSANPEPEVCRFAETPDYPVFKIGCNDGADITVTLSYTENAAIEAHNIGFRAYNPIESTMTAYGPAVRTASCVTDSTFDVTQYGPAIELTLSSESTPYVGTVGTVTADVSY